MSSRKTLRQQVSLAVRLKTSLAGELKPAGQTPQLRLQQLIQHMVVRLAARQLAAWRLAVQLAARQLAAWWLAVLLTARLLAVLLLAAWWLAVVLAAWRLAVVLARRQLAVVLRTAWQHIRHARHVRLTIDELVHAELSQI